MSESAASLTRPLNLPWQAFAISVPIAPQPMMPILIFFERIAPYKRSGNLKRWRSPFLRERQGNLPDGPSGGFKLTGLKSVTENEALEEIRERFLPNGDL